MSASDDLDFYAKKVATYIHALTGTSVQPVKHHDVPPKRIGAETAQTHYGFLTGDARETSAILVVKSSEYGQGGVTTEVKHHITFYPRGYAGPQRNLTHHKDYAETAIPTLQTWMSTEPIMFLRPTVTVKAYRILRRAFIKARLWVADARSPG